MQEVGEVQILVVDDGSEPAETHATRAIIESLRPNYPLLQPLLELPNNIGKGGAVYAGWTQANPDTQWLAFVDADGSISPQEVTRLITLAHQFSPSSSESPISNVQSSTFEVQRSSPISESPPFDDQSSTFEVQSSSPPALFASRVKMLGRVVNRQFKRHLLGRIYATLVSESLNIPIYDSQCGLKLIPAPAFRAIQNQLSILGFAFDVDLLVHLIDHGTPVIEVPIDWHEEPGGKVHLLRDSCRMAQDVLQIRQHRRPL
jgi:glycosyltransferase involved in cell wall biosynthesis